MDVAPAELTTVVNRQREKPLLQHVRWTHTYIESDIGECRSHRVEANGSLYKCDRSMRALSGLMRTAKSDQLCIDVLAYNASLDENSQLRSATSIEPAASRAPGIPVRYPERQRLSLAEAYSSSIVATAVFPERLSSSVV